MFNRHAAACRQLAAACRSAAKAVRLQQECSASTCQQVCLLSLCIGMAPALVLHWVVLTILQQSVASHA